MPQIIGFATTRTPAEKESIKQSVIKLFTLRYLKTKIVT